MRWSALRGRALDEAAAALLEYFDAAAEVSPVMHGSTGTPADEPTCGVQWADFGADATMHSAAAAEEKAEVGRELLQMTDGGAETLRMLQTAGEAAQETLRMLQTADEAAQEGRSGFLPQRMDALHGAQQEMDEISEFFRRDSRRYDNGFSGGYGL